MKCVIMVFFLAFKQRKFLDTPYFYAQYKSKSIYKLANILLICYNINKQSKMKKELLRK